MTLLRRFATAALVALFLMFACKLTRIACLTLAVAVPKRKHAFLLAAIVVLLVLGINKSAQCEGISITNFALSPTSVSFGISGTFPSSAPVTSRNALYFVNPNVFANPGFALGSFVDSSSSSFTGAQALRVDPKPIAIGGSQFGDYFYVSFENPFSAGETISGTTSATWNQTAFAPGAVSSLNVFWGTADNFAAVGTGTLLTTVPVPEPSTYAIAVAGMVGGLAVWRRRRT